MIVCRASTFVRVLVSSVLVVGAQNAAAIGDSGGCTVDIEYQRLLSHGSVAEVAAHIDAKVTARAAYIENERKKKKKGWFQSAQSSPTVSDDQFRAGLIRNPVPCGYHFPVEYAAGHGNLEVLKWLLDAGADPSARSIQRNVFTKCLGLAYGPAPDVPRNRAIQRQGEAYRLLIEKGADVNEQDAFNSITGCINEEMFPLLRDLGARLTREAFFSRIQAARSGDRVDERRWSTVEQMATWQPFDFRGTAVEDDLVTMLRFRKGMSDYNAVVDLTKRVGTVARLSPGVIPGQPARPEDVPKQFVPHRETCFFPEISAYPDFEFVALWRESVLEQATSSPAMDSADSTRVKVGRTKAPVLLMLFNNRNRPTLWKVEEAQGAQVIGVIVLEDSLNQRGARDTLSFDPQRPVYFGKAGGCYLLALPRSDSRARNELRPYWTPRPDSISFNPVTLRGEPSITTASGDEFIVGDLSRSGALTGWVDSVRMNTKTPR